MRNIQNFISLEELRAALDDLQDCEHGRRAVLACSTVDICRELLEIAVDRRLVCIKAPGT